MGKQHCCSSGIISIPLFSPTVLMKVKARTNFPKLLKVPFLKAVPHQHVFNSEVSDTLEMTKIMLRQF